MSIRLATVSELEVLHAMETAFHDFKLVVKSGGSVGLASRQENFAPCDTVLVMLSGGRVVDAEPDPAVRICGLFESRPLRRTKIVI
ncbi:MAG: hypothetical protein HRT36_04850 [Alphaproteobacteria bacterium]|nr:hypothetical protein [Alphaproteobacteria bacterium]